MFKKRENSDGFIFDYIAVTTNTFGTKTGGKADYAGADDPDNDIGVRTAVLSKLIGAVLTDYKQLGRDTGFIFAMPEFLFRPKSGSYPPETLGTLSGTLINSITRLDREGRGLYVLGSVLVAGQASGGTTALLNVVPILSAEMGKDGAQYKCSFLFKHNVSGIDYLTVSGDPRSRAGDSIRVGAGIGSAPMPAKYARAYDKVSSELAKLGFLNVVPQCVFDVGGGYKLGIEVCLDHIYDILSDECGTTQSVGAHLVVSCGMNLGVRNAKQPADGVKSCATVLKGGASMLCDGMQAGKIAVMERTGTAATASAFTEKTHDSEVKFTLDATTLRDTFGLDASRVSADEAKECFPGGFTSRCYRELKFRK